MRTVIKLRNEVKYADNINNFSGNSTGSSGHTDLHIKIGGMAMESEVLGYIFCGVMTVGLFGIIWVLSKILSIFTDKMLPEPEDF